MGLAVGSGSHELARTLLAAGASPLGVSGAVSPLESIWITSLTPKPWDWSQALGFLRAGVGFSGDDVALAIHLGVTELLGAMVDLGFDLTAPVHYGLTTLERTVDASAPPGGHSWCGHRAVAVLKMAQETGVDLNAISPSGVSLAMRAASIGSRQVLHFLELAGADLSARTAAGFCAADFARAAGFKTLASQLDHRLKTAQDNAMPLFISSELLDSWGYLLDATSPNGGKLTPALSLHDMSSDAQVLRACFKGSAKELALALDSGGRPDAGDAFGTRALFIACSHTDPHLALACARSLLMAGADPNPPAPECSGLDDLSLQIRLRTRGFLDSVLAARRHEVVELLFAAGTSCVENLSIMQSSQIPLLAQPADPRSMDALLAAGYDPRSRPWLLPTTALLRSAMVYTFLPDDAKADAMSVYLRVVEMCGGPLAAGIGPRELARHAIGGRAKYALGVLEAWERAGVEFRARSTPHAPDMVEQARAAGWEAGASWMTQAHLARTERLVLQAMMPESSLDAPAPHRARTSL